MNTKRTKYAIWDNGALRPASRRMFAGSEKIPVITLAEAKLGLKYYGPNMYWQEKK